MLCSSGVALFGRFCSPRGAHEEWEGCMGLGDLILQPQHQHIFINANGLSSNRSIGYKL